LPEALIAQTPLERRDASRLLVLPRERGEVSHHRFSDLPDLLREGDLLIMNDSRVIPARLFGRVETGAAVEILLLRDLGASRWETLVRPGRKFRAGTRIIFDSDLLSGTVSEVLENGNRVIEFNYSGIFMEVLEKLGRTPLPPYIHEELADSERYQTIYSREPGSAAAPTAGLHFTDELFRALEDKGIKRAFVTLHVGLGTFRPVKAENIEEHDMHSEFCVIPPETARAISETKANGGRVIAVGTTSCRTLESFAGSGGTISENSGFTNIFIYPGYKFKLIDGLITNFHLPESTLIMLVSALAGRERVLDAYNTAIAEEYRFFSFGDAMLIV